MKEEYPIGEIFRKGEKDIITVAEVQFARTYFGSEEVMRMTVRDEVSNQPIIDITMPLLSFARALTNMGSQIGFANIEYSDCHGQLRIGRNEIVSVEGEKGYPNRDDQEERMLAKLTSMEHKGWKGDKTQLTNGHYWTYEETRARYKTYFSKTVPVDAGKLRFSDLSEINLETGNKRWRDVLAEQIKDDPRTAWDLLSEDPLPKRGSDPVKRGKKK